MTVPEKNFIYILKNLHRQSSLQSQLSEPVDWEAVLRAASKQNLLPLVYNVASEYPGFAEFDEEHPVYMMAAMQMLRTQVQNTAELLALYRAFLNAGVAPVVVKGIVCRSLYGEQQDFRISGDEDILIEKKDYEAAKQVLCACGYRTDKVADKGLNVVQEITFYNEEGLVVELHMNPFGEENQIRSRMNTWFRDSFRTTETLEVGGVELRVLSPTDNLLFLLFHAFKHFLSAGMGIRMALDILLYTEKYQERVDWKYIRRALEDVRATAFAADLIVAGNKYLGFDLHIDGLNQSVSPDELLEDMLCMGTFGISTQIDADAQRFTEAVIEGKKNSRIADTFHLIFPSWSQWKGFKPYLVDKPWMLPVEWCRRVGRFWTKKDNVNFSESRKVADRRLELMRKYKVI